jgi:Flp pilus assembly pilin Flp
MEDIKMNFLNDNSGQGAAEYILLFGGVIVIAIAALLIYQNYVKATNPLRAGTDVNNVRNNMTSRG